MSKPLANLGDVDYIEHGGFFVFESTPPDLPCIEILVEPDEDGPQEWLSYLIEMEPHTYTADGQDLPTNFTSGILSDNQFHKSTAAWYADDLESVAETTDYPNGVAGLRTDLCSGKPEIQAGAYQALVSYYGPYEFDQSPEVFTQQQAEKLYSD